MKFSQDDLIGRKMENGVSGKLLTGGRLGVPHMTRLNLLAGCLTRKLPVKRRKIFPRAFINKYIYLKMKNSTIFLFQGRKKKKKQKENNRSWRCLHCFLIVFPDVSICTRRGDSLLLHSFRECSNFFGNYRSHLDSL